MWLHFTIIWSSRQMADRSDCTTGRNTCSATYRAACTILEWHKCMSSWSERKLQIEISIWVRVFIELWVSTVECDKTPVVMHRCYWQCLDSETRCCPCPLLLLLRHAKVRASYCTLCYCYWFFLFDLHFDDRNEKGLSGFSCEEVRGLHHLTGQTGYTDHLHLTNYFCESILIYRFECKWSMIENVVEKKKIQIEREMTWSTYVLRGCHRSV